MPVAAHEAHRDDETTARQRVHLPRRRQRQVGPMLVTRLAGHRVVLARERTGLGVLVWAGEFRTDSDGIAEVHGGRGATLEQALRFGTLAGVLTSLASMATAEAFR